VFIFLLYLVKQSQMKTFKLIVIFLFSLGTFAQNSWQEKIFDRNENFNVIVDDFNSFKSMHLIENNKIPKGFGIKQFERWRYYWQNRVDVNGNFPKQGNVLNEMIKYREVQSSLRYTSGPGTWELVGPIPVPNNGTGQLNGNGRLNCVTFHPTDPNIIYVGAPSGGVWKSLDNGLKWTEYSSGLVRLGVSSIVINPSNPDIIYIGTGDKNGGDAPGYGVWRSLDGGVTWNAHNSGMGNRTVYEILMHPSNPDILIASTNGNRIYRSINGGLSWNFATTSSEMKDIAFKPGDPSVIYASGTSFDVSINQGVSFTRITSGVPTGVQRIAIAVSANQPNYVYMVAGNGTGLVGIFRSINSGVNFTTRTTTPNILGYETNGSDTASQAWYDLVIAADPTNADIIYTGGINIWKSVDGGATMNCASYWIGTSGVVDGVHADQHVLEFSPYTNNLFSGNDGGLYITTDGATNWTDLSSGLAIAQLYKIGVSQTVSNLVINGHQDNGTSVSRGTDFSTEIGGDGMECIIDPTDDNFMYGALYYGDIRRSTNGGINFSIIADQGSNGITEGGAWVTPYKLDPNNAARMFIGYNNIWRSNDVKTPAANAVAWTKISSFANTSDVVDLAIAPSNSNIMYVSKGGSSNLYRTNNALSSSPTWIDLEVYLPATGTPKDIEINHLDPTRLFIALGNDIYESIDSGLSWTNISGTLPNISLNTIVIDPLSSVGAMYIGMDVGVYYRDENLSDWVSHSGGLANLEITELEIYSNIADCKSKLYAATYGQGLWMSDLKDPGNVAPTVCFAANETIGCSGNDFILTDNSDFSPSSWSWTITPATFVYVNGTSSTAQNPEVRFTNAGSYSVELTATNSIGSNTLTKVSYLEINSGAVAISFNEDFEGETICTTATNCGTTSCGLSGFWTNLTNGTDDNIDWRVDEGGTPSTGTGPNLDYKPGTATGNYIYLEASSCSNQIAILESQCMEIDQGYDFTFAYHMYGNNMGSLHVDLFVGGLWQEDIVAAFSGDLGNVWNIATVDLAPYVGKTIKVRLRGITGAGFTSDIAIDDIQLTPKCFGTTTWNGNVWSNGVPTIVTPAIINGDYNTTTNLSFKCCSLLINAGFELNINDSNYLVVKNEIVNNGILNVKNNGSLIQINDIDANVGNITYQRTASIREQDYVFWSSPVKNFNVAGISPLTPAANIFKWNPILANPNGSQGDWINTPSEIMSEGVGYIVKGPNTFTATPQNFTALFNNGLPNNGLIQTPISRGNYTGADYAGTNSSTITRFTDNWNVIGNPYPSSISAIDFLNLNNTKIEGSIRIWTHETLPNSSAPNPFYGGNYTTSYSVSDYIVHNGTGTVNGPAGFNGLIAGAQSFVVLMNDGAATTDNITFNNALRSETYSNNQFYRTTNASQEKNRIWLDLSNGASVSDRTLIGYVDGATIAKDRLYDAFTKADLDQQRIYTFIGNDKMIIQAFGLPFSEEDTIPFGVTIPVDGNYTIAIHAVDGLFTNKQVFVEDLSLNITADISMQPYSFYADANQISDRFLLKFKNAVLSTDDFDFNDVIVSGSNLINIESKNEKIKDISIFDVLGRRLVEQKNLNTNRFEINTLTKSKTPLFIKIILENNQVVYKKYIF